MLHWLRCCRPVIAGSLIVGCRSRGAHSVSDLYATLGVASHASAVEIKSAFIRQAKLLHPDINAGAAASSSDSTAFIAVLAAYETLSDPSRRSQYDAHRKLSSLRRAPDPRFSSRSAHGADSGWERSSDHSWWERHRDRKPAQTERTVRPRFNEDPSRIFGGIGGIARRAYEGGSGSIWDALKRAHDGPAFLGGAGDFPYAFELDQRNAVDASEDVLRMMVGRQLLGVVRQQAEGATLHRVAAGRVDAAAGGCKLYPNAAASRAAAGHASGAAAVGDSRRSQLPASPEPPLAFNVMGQDVARAVLMQPPPAAAPSASNGGSDDAEAAAASLRELLMGADRNPYRRCVVAVYQTNAAVGGPAPAACGSPQEHPIAYILPAEGVRWAYLRRVVATHTAAAVNGRRTKPASPAEAATVAEAADLADKSSSRSTDATATSHAAATAARAADSGNLKPDASSSFGSSPQPQSSWRQSPSPPIDERPYAEPFRERRAAPAEEVTVGYGVCTSSPAGSASGAGSSSSRASSTSLVAAGERGGSGAGDEDPEFAALVARARARSRRPTISDALRPPDEDEALAGSPPRPSRFGGPGQHDSHKRSSGEPHDADDGELRAAPRLRRHGFGAAFRPEDAAEAAAAAAQLARVPRWNQSREWISYGGDSLGIEGDGEGGAGMDMPHFIASPMGSAVLAAAAAAAHARAECADATTTTCDATTDGNAARPDAGQQLKAAIRSSSATAVPAAAHPLAQAQHATHSLAVFRTPGAARMRLTRHGDGSVEASGSRASLPPAAAWLWSPASEAHTRGSFYFEMARRRLPRAAVATSTADDRPLGASSSDAVVGQHQAHGLPAGWCDGACHPAVVVMMSAIMTLEKEWDEAQVQAQAEEHHHDGADRRTQADSDAGGENGSSRRV